MELRMQVCPESRTRFERKDTTTLFAEKVGQAFCFLHHRETICCSSLWFLSELCVCRSAQVAYIRDKCSNTSTSRRWDDSYILPTVIQLDGLKKRVRPGKKRKNSVSHANSYGRSKASK